MSNEFYEVKAELEMLARRYDKCAKQNTKFKEATMWNWHRDKQYAEMEESLEFVTKEKEAYQANHKSCVADLQELEKEANDMHLKLYGYERNRKYE